VVLMSDGQRNALLQHGAAGLLSAALVANGLPHRPAMAVVAVPVPDGPHPVRSTSCHGAILVWGLRAQVMALLCASTLLGDDPQTAGMDCGSTIVPCAQQVIVAPAAR
jgi:hypothetical protein